MNYARTLILIVWKAWTCRLGLGGTKMASAKQLTSTVWKGIAKRELRERLTARWSLSDFLDDKKCPLSVKRYVMNKYVTEQVEEGV